ncbi:MAG: 3',5'-cyclic-AMP phosphodiesterase [Synechococcus sp.]
MTDSSLYVIQITDTHLFSHPETQLLGVSTEETFQTVLNTVRRLAPQADMVLATGDLSQDGSLVSYQRFRKSVARLNVDTYWLAGNHDCLPEMEVALGNRLLASGSADRLFADKSFVRNRWRFILLNSAVPEQVAGRLAPTELEYLQEQLQRATEQQQYAAVCLHHPPYLMESQWLDSSTLENSEELLSLLGKFDCVRAVLFGHVHQDWEYRQGAVTFLGCPSTCVQFKPESEKFAVDSNAPGIRQLWFHPDGQLETEILRIVDAKVVPDRVAVGY